MITAQEFITQRNGKAVDVDGYYGAQCWDLFAYFCKQAGYTIINCTSTGYVKDIWVNRKTNGALKNFDEVQTMQKGDWCIWGDCAAAPSSHIAMFVEDVDGKRGKFLGQNQGSSVANIITMPYAGSLGALRPKCYVAKKATCPFKSSGKVQATVDGIRVRTAASTSKGDTGLRYNKGMTLTYNKVVNADGWWWAVYTRSLNGAKGTGYCALCKTDGTSKYWKQA